MNNFDGSLPVLNDDNLIKLLFNKNDLFDDNKNQSIVMCTVSRVKTGKVSNPIHSKNYYSNNFYY